MPEQFAAYRNPGSNRHIPYLLAVQSNRFRDSVVCVVVPLLSASSLRVPESDISPRFRVEGQLVTLDPLQIAHVRADALKTQIASLATQEDRIVKALDILLSTAWR